MKNTSFYFLIVALFALTACGDDRAERRAAIAKQNADFEWEVDPEGHKLINGIK